jgi:hypothetical protein
VTDGTIDDLTDLFNALLRAAPQRTARSPTVTIARRALNEVDLRHRRDTALAVETINALVDGDHDNSVPRHDRAVRRVPVQVSHRQQPPAGSARIRCAAVPSAKQPASRPR